MTRFHSSTLPENFRSARSICRAASKLIGSEVKPMREEEGIVAIRIFEDEHAECKFVVNHIADLAFETQPKPTIAVLCRTNLGVQRWSDALANEGFKVATRKLEHLPAGWEALKLTLAFFASPESNYLAHRFLASIWSKKKADEALASATKQGKTLNQFALSFPANPDTSPATMKSFLDARSAVPLSSIDWLCERLKEMPSGLSMGDILIFLNEMESKGTEFDDGADVIISTVHSFKGLEKNAVVIPGCAEGFFPLGNGDFDEEKRLFYVALTRARDSVLCTCARRVWTKWDGIRDVEPSRFLEIIK